MSEETNYFTYFVDPFSVSVSYVEDRIHIFVLHKCIQREYMTTIEEEDFPCFDLKALFVMIKKCFLAFGDNEETILNKTTYKLIINIYESKLNLKFIAKFDEFPVKVVINVKEVKKNNQQIISQILENQQKILDRLDLLEKR